MELVIELVAVILYYVVRTGMLGCWDAELREGALRIVLIWGGVCVKGYGDEVRGMMVKRGKGDGVEYKVWGTGNG